MTRKASKKTPWVWRYAFGPQETLPKRLDQTRAGMTGRLGLGAGQKKHQQHHQY